MASGNQVLASFADEMVRNAACRRWFATAPFQSETCMTDRIALLEAALDSLPDGIALIDGSGLVVFWNQAAEAITGYTAGELLARPAPETLSPLLLETAPSEELEIATPDSCRATLVRLHHKLGHELPVIARTVVLRDGLGEHIGATAVFHPVEPLDALPHGESSDYAGDASQADFEDRLGLEFDNFERGGSPLGILWIGVDQAAELRKTHGAGACHAMLDKVQHALARGLRPGEEMGRWGADEFLVIAHERSPEMLATHAQTLAGLARTADFRWWGDRLSLTVSIGAAQAVPGRDRSLAPLLALAREGVETSMSAGGNRVTFAPRHFDADDASSSAGDLAASSVGRQK
jgi:PAS domain S-box-containing protein/diguanylate cyclase (GGDEF)-like protein